MFRKASLVVGALFSLTATVTEAQQQNPLLNFLQAIDKTIKQGAANTSQTSGTEIDILKTYAAADTGAYYAEDACHMVANEIGVKRNEANFKLGDYVSASAGYLLAAQNIAQCAVGPTGAAQPSRIPVSQAIDGVGVNLGMSVIAAKAGGLITSQTVTNAKNAVTLLSVNKAANENLIQKVKETGLVGDTTPKTVSNVDSFHMTAKDAVSAYKNNAFAFKSKYDGKVLTISGTIQSINGSGQQATVTLLGYTPDHGDHGFQDVVRCEVSDPTALNSVMNLKRGDTANITGLFAPAKQLLQIGIELQRCKAG